MAWHSRSTGAKTLGIISAAAAATRIGNAYTPPQAFLPADPLSPNTTDLHPPLQRNDHGH